MLFDCLRLILHVLDWNCEYVVFSSSISPVAVHRKGWELFRGSTSNRFQKLTDRNKRHICCSGKQQEMPASALQGHGWYSSSMLIQGFTNTLPEDLSWNRCCGWCVVLKHAYVHICSFLFMMQIFFSGDYLGLTWVEKKWLLMTADDCWSVLPYNLCLPCGWQQAGSKVLEAVFPRVISCRMIRTIVCLCTMHIYICLERERESERQKEEECREGVYHDMCLLKLRVNLDGIFTLRWFPDISCLQWYP